MVKFKDWTDLTYVVSRIRIAAKGDRYSIGGEKKKKSHDKIWSTP